MKKFFSIMVFLMVAIFGSQSIATAVDCPTQLTNNSYGDYWPKINDNGYVVWRGFDGSDYEIFLYDGTTTTQITNNSYDDKYTQINDNGYVVWAGSDGSDDEIFLYDGATTTQITNNICGLARGRRRRRL
jgi:hypothetical protein